MNKLQFFGIATAMALLISACGSSGGGATCPTTGSGSLAVSILGLPVGVNGAVTVTGSGAPQNLTATQTLSGLAAGSYTITATKVTQPDPLVRTVFSASVASSPSCVRDGQSTTVNVTYAAIPSSNKLWISNGSGGTGQFQGFASSLLATSGAKSASVVATAGITANRGMAFDKDGNLWVTDGQAGVTTLKRYPASALGNTGAKTPDVVIGGAALNGGIPGAGNIAFDSSGNLWFSNLVRDVVGRYSPSQIAVSGSPTPSVELGGFNGPGALAFDGSGNLWVANNGAARVLKFNAGDLNTTATAPTPALTIEAKTPPPVIGTYGDPSGLAFDKDGNLWLVYNTATIVRLTPADQSGSGAVSLTPSVQINVGVTVLAESLAFDESGGLWFAFSAGKIARLDATQLTTSAGSGSPRTPSTVITGNELGFSADVIFYPAPSNLPLYHKVP